MWCGASAVLFGFLYGSVFGFKDILPYKGFEPVENVNALLTIALFFGMTMITLGLVCNAITSIARKQWAAGLLQWRGLMGVSFYWVGVALITRVLSGKSDNGALLTVLIVIPFMAAVVSGLLRRESHTHRRRSVWDVARQVLGSLGHMLGECFETVLQFFTNTISFLRVAAFAMAHAALFIAVFSLADVLRGGGLALPVLIHILGNAGMIALEGLIVCVQALRLEYYEFFGKFFRVGKTIFTPVRLQSTPSS
jgi:V/A-type H+-transporting ATPase subunit I